MVVSLTLGVACGARTELGVLEIEGDDSGTTVDSGRDGSIGIFYGAVPYDASVARDADAADASRDTATADRGPIVLYGAPPPPDE